MNLKLLLCSCVIALPLTVMADEVYSWIDSNGVRHFSDKPPQGVERGQVKGGITTGKLKQNKFNTMQPYVPPTPEKLTAPISNPDDKGEVAEPTTVTKEATKPPEAT